MSLLNDLLPLLATIAAVMSLPVAMIFLCSFLRRAVDDRGLYRDHLILMLPIIAGGVIESYVLASTGLVHDLTPAALWGREGWWHVDLAGLYFAHLSPPVIADLFGRALDQALIDWPANDLWAIALVGLFLPVIIRASSLWHSVRAVPAAALFLPIALTSALIAHYIIILAFWTIYWLNFWVFFVLFALVQMRRHENPNKQLLAP